MKVESGLTGKSHIEFLMKNKAEILEIAKHQQKYTEAAAVVIEADDSVTKDNFLYDNDEAAGILKRTIVANTYNWLDAHDDVHIPGLFTKSVQNSARRIRHLHDHKFEYGGQIGRPIQFYDKGMKWRALGHPKNGDTTVLVMESQIEKDLNPMMYREYLGGHVDQHSVKMTYVKVDLAINDENYQSEYKTWSEVFPTLGNKDAAESQGYFWAVREARLHEVSAVLVGSNELTPTLGNKSQPALSTERKEPATQRTPVDVHELITHYKKHLLYG